MKAFRSAFIGLLFIISSIVVSGCGGSSSSSEEGTKSTGVAGVWDSPNATWDNVDWQ